MRRYFTRAVRCSLAGVVVLSASAVAFTQGAGIASASACSNGGTGSSLLNAGSVTSPLGSIGSLGFGSSGGSAVGPQGPLPVYIGPNTRTVGWVTGPRSANRTFSRFAISGTDLGIGWDNGHGQTLMAFGDTFGNCRAIGQQWRHNTLLRTNDNNLADGLSIPNGVAGDVRSGAVIAPGQPNVAQQLIPSLGISQLEVTAVPTAGIALPWGHGYRQFINYMSVRSWGSPGNWVTNFSAIAYSDNNGETWTTDRNTIRINTPFSAPLPPGLPRLEHNDGKFQQNAYVRGRPDDPAERGYLYQIGTPNGRFGAAYLARVRPQDILNLNRYQYWAGPKLKWVNNIAQVPDSAVIVRQPVSELSVSWSPYLHKYVMIDGQNDIRLRTADHPEGPWSRPVALVTSGYPVLYGPMMLPQSPALRGTGKDLYFNASRWSDYDVMLMRTDLSKVPH